MIKSGVPEYEHPGVYVEERASPTPIDGVPTDDGDALTAADRATWIYRVMIGGLVLTGLGFGLAVIRGNLILAIIRMPGGIELLGAIFVSAFVLAIVRPLVERRRRMAGRPELRVGKFVLGIVSFKFAALVAANLGLVALAASLLAGSALAPLLVAAGSNLLVGYVFVSLMAGALRDLLLLAQAARSVT